MFKFGGEVEYGCVCFARGAGGRRCWDGVSEFDMDLGKEGASWVVASDGLVT